MATIETTGGLDEELLAELRQAARLAGGLDDYVEACTSPASPALRRLAERTATERWDEHTDAPAPLEQEMLSGHVEGQTLAFLVHATGARRVLELGMFTGYSALAMAEALPEDGELVACEIDPGVAAFAQDSFDASPAGRRIIVRVGPASQTLAALAEAGDCFDLIFIDADKAGYASYFAQILDAKLLTAQGLLLVDNTLMQGQPWLPGSQTANGTAIAAFNEIVSADPRVEQVLLPLRDGLTLIRQV